MRPGMGAGRPGVGAGGIGGPASGIGIRPGAGAGLPGVGLGGVGGPYSGLGVLPGVGFGRPGLPGGLYAGAFYATSGTYYASDESLATQAVAVNDAGEYPAYTNEVSLPPSDADVTSPATAEVPAAPDLAWHPKNLTSPSIYTKPSYGQLVAGLGVPAQPLMYDYGGNVVIQKDSVYVNGVFLGTPQQYAEQAAQIAAAGVTDPPAETKWLPLGVFAIVEGTATTSDEVFLIAIDQRGIIRGNYHNVKVNQLIAISGSIDPRSQRAAWTSGDDKLPVYEAGVGNLTKDATTMLVHLPDGTSHQMSLIRLAQPQ